ncbi:MAG TPA: septum formation family protein [Candidatus Limnocylindrales bacterium]|jgi:hypothetical protein
MKNLRSIIVILVIVGGIAVVGFAFRDRLSGNAGELQVGDCFQVPDGDSISDVQHQPCNEAHDGEVFVVADYTGASTTYPTPEEFDAWVGTACVNNAFPTYTGTAYDSRDDLDIGYFYPLEENWGKGERQMICYLTPVGVDSVTASYKQGQAAPSSS